MPGNSASSLGALQTLKITDWTPGIISQDYVASAEQVNINRVPTSSTSSTGNTYGVCGLPGGGLLLGPSVSGGTPVALSNIPSGYGGSCLVGGTLNFLDGTYLPLNLMAVSIYKATNTLCNLYDINGNNVWTYSSITAVSADIHTIPLLPFSTIMSTSGTGDFENYVGIGNNIYGQYNVPVVTQFIPGTPQSATQMASVDGIAIPANGRVWELSAGIKTAFDVANNSIFAAINYNAPSDGTTVNTTLATNNNTLIDYDNPSSFGAWGTVSSSEMLLVKTGAGGVIVSGDIFNPTISRAPAVFGTGGLIGQAALTPIGLVYRSQQNGVWAWSGGAAAQKISPQVSDSAWSLVTYGYNVQLYRQFIFTDAGYFMDLSTNAWWRLPPWGYNGSSYVAQALPNYYSLYNNSTYFGGTFDMIGWSSTPTASSQIIGTNYSFGYDNPSIPITPPANYYSSFWESNPIILDDDDLVEVQEINITMQGAGTLYVAVLGIGGAAATFKSVIVNNSTYKQIPLNVSFRTDSVVIQIGFKNQIGATAAVIPIIQQVAIKYRTVYPIARAN